MLPGHATASTTVRFKKNALFENTSKKWFVGSFYTHPGSPNHSPPNLSMGPF